MQENLAGFELVLVVLLVTTFACDLGSADVDPVSVEEQSESRTVFLAAPKEVDGFSTMAPTWTDRDTEKTLIRIPNWDAKGSILRTAYGEHQLELGFEQGPEGWSVSADLDANGILDETERKAMVPNDEGEPAVVLFGAVQRGSVSVPVSIRVATRLTEGRRVFLVAVNARRAGVFPNGVPFELFSHGGVYDHPKSRVVVDEDGDGEPDLANWFASYRVGHGVLEARGQRWAYTTAPDGSSLTLTPSDAPVDGLRKGQLAPPFSVVASDGEKHDLSRYSGQWLLLDFWATWCAPCIALHPEVAALAERYDVAVLGISADEKQTVLNRWLKKHPVPWPSAAIGPEGDINLAYGVNAWPTHVLIDGDGRLVVQGLFEALEKALKSSEFGNKRLEP